MKVIDMLQKMKHSPIGNYGGIPGLTSWLIGTPGPQGLVRLMECSRKHEEPIIPHSHRFDFHCQVLAGEVGNVIWERDIYGTSDEFQQTTMRYAGRPGAYDAVASEVGRWIATRKTYTVNDEYSMTADQVHSIFFSRGAAVLFFEGPTVTDTSIILEPFVNGEVVPTFKVEPWMFKRVSP